MAVRFNAGAIDYRQSILAGLKAEGHQILDGAKVKFQQPEIKPKSTTDIQTETKLDSCLVAAISEISSQNYLAECQEIANSESLDQKQYQDLKKRLIKSLSDRRKLRKHELQQRYHLPITPDLVALDDSGWYQKIRLHYFLTIGRSYLADRDAKVARRLIEQGDGSIFLPDFNSSQLGALVGTLEIIGIPVLLQNTTRQLRNTDLDLQALAAIAHSNRQEIKTILGIGIAKNFSPITIVSRLLDRIGCKIKCVRYESQNKKRVRVYKILPPEDLREQVFAHWLSIDRQLPGNSLFWSENKALNSYQSVTNNTQSKYLQLSLEI